MKDLAKELKTTVSTVSRALQNDPRISDSTRKKVIALAKKKNYQVNLMASGLRMGKTNTLGVIVPRINRDFFANVISGIEEVAHEAGFKVIICQSHDDTSLEEEHIDTLLSNGVSGILISCGLDTQQNTHFQKVKSAGIPLIFFDRVADDFESVKVVNDDREGAYKATKHLIDQGYKRIAHFAGPLHINVYRNRKEGYVNALVAHNLPVDNELIISNDMTQAAGTRDIQPLMDMKNPPDALFSASDYAALGALQHIQKMNIAIPEQFGLVGYSNEKWTELITPSLTTVDQHGEEIGRYSAKIFLEETQQQLGTPMVSRTINLDAHLLVRASSNKKKE